MRAAAGFLTVLCIGALSQALATEPPSSAPQAAPESATSAQANSTAADPAAKPPEAKAASPAASAPAPHSAAPQVSLKAGDAVAEAQLKKLRAAGYKPEVRRGEVFFCRNEAPLGSRLEKKVCSTAGQLLDAQAQGQEATRDVQRAVVSTPPR